MITIEQLHKQYDQTVALRGISLEIAAGGIVGILGPNGAGKTTLVEIIEGLRHPSAGQLSVLGLNPVKRSQDLKERIGVLLQSTALPQDLTPQETVRLYAAFYQKALPVKDVLASVDLSGKAGDRNRHLSGGQKQRLAIGLALVNDPELVLLDEPTTGLDPVARRGVHGIIEELRQRGRTVLLTTHYIEEAEKLCDRVLMIRDGQIVADDSPFELVSRSAGTSTIWIQVDGSLDPAPLLAAGAIPLGEEGNYQRFSTTDPTAAILALGEILRAQQVKLLDLRMKRPTLEDVYLELVGEPEKETSEGAI